ncbi:hypothetical protein GCM10007320_09160 [Pseudorhodoferax aquiterrae]|uniref:Uncharacterized protein n=1 Tax=Pseudorhodoferax aquiterrae TaxID=747304 RepID=A0ABQ3FX37_9BURK|nr:hypothetical protein [Pseudorhodoferax aquiterrae]GHC72931.1 hypothetical protein GCM10007320_09160 [Pseudorhodoferax aquiterrae]
MSLKPDTLRIGGRYNWKNQPERLVYLGLCEPRNGRWHQFAKVDAPDVVWCEVIDADLSNFEVTPAARPQCAVGGMFRPGVMCGSVIVGGKLCGFAGDCTHKRAAAA